VGDLPLNRAYYHCPSCGRGAIPWDEALGLSRQALTPGARELVCIAGAVDSFAEAADVVLRKLSGLRVSESTAERTSEATGHDMAAGWRLGRPSGRASRGPGTRMPRGRPVLTSRST
jgi:hypothetical protein